MSRALQPLGRQAEPSPPEGITLEKPARNLAALATTEALDALRGLVVAQWRHGEAFARLARHGIRPVDRLLFYGPPGNGKTMASQWLAAQIGAPLYRVRCESLVVALMGATGSRLAAALDWLADQPRCVVLFDEVETLFQSRNIGDAGGPARELASVMQIFWQALDRWEAPTLFILATNLPERLDPALLSRVDVQLEFGPPTPEQGAAVALYWAEVLHEYGGDAWGPELAAVENWASFRALFHAVQQRVREFVVAGPPPT